MARKLLAKFDAGLVKRIDAVESTEHRGLVFVECHQRPQTSRIKLINADRGYSIEAVSFFTRDQRFGLSLGAHYPVAGGTLKAQIAMRDMENQDGVDFTRWIAGAGYDYPLSKRTSVYAMAGYSVEKIEKKNGDEAKPNGCEAKIGMVHRF